MNRVLACVVFAALTAAPAFGDDAVACVQQKLVDLGYAPGPVDGAMGRRTRDAASGFASETGSSLPSLDAANASTWCDTLTEFAAGPMAAAITSPARMILPADVLLDLARVNEAGIDATYCAPPSKAAMSRALSVDPIRRINGFNSRMDNRELVENAVELDDFVAAFGAGAVAALVDNDSERKAELVRVFAKWARADALLETISCVVSDGGLTNRGACTEWTQDDGQDPSGMKDATFVTFNGAAMVRAYYAALADADPEGLADEHAAIRAWIAKWSKRLKRPTDVYFGMNVGWYWPNIMNDFSSGQQDRARERLAHIAQVMPRLINSDGSIDLRTTRGDRALWYHYVTLGEIVMTMEFARAAGLTVPAELEEKLHKAVRIFVEGVKDHDTLDRWARLRHHSVYNGTQEWGEAWWEYEFGGTWLHVYPYRYAGTELAEELRALVPEISRSAIVDTDLGIGLGCVYNTAALAKGGRDLTPAPKVVVEPKGVTVAASFADTVFSEYWVTVPSVQVDDRQVSFRPFRVFADYSSQPKRPANIMLLRFVFWKSQLIDPESRAADYSSCSEIAYHAESNGESLRLHFGREASSNACILEKMTSRDRTIWSSVFSKFPEMLKSSDTDAGKELLGLIQYLE